LSVGSPPLKRPDEEEGGALNELRDGDGALNELREEEGALRLMEGALREMDGDE
jgi:hypothetical protein